ncbi:MAG TPA: Ig-like domain-containing protein, partial [Gemmatimonadaceae bacterium]|nr:Ig-like domain-containing protein [Gemmatimonadaceae bacterium]
MRPNTLARAFALLACGILAACGDSRSTAPIIAADAAATAPQPNLAAAATCSPTINISNLIDAANLAFGAGSPDANSAIGKLGQLNALVVAQDGAAARTKALEIIEFTLRKNSQRALPGGADAVVSFVNAVACFAGLNFAITTPDGVYFIFPTDAPQILKSADGWAGISLPANPVFEPSIIQIAPIPFVVATPGDGPLTTELDQYRGFYSFELGSASNGKLLAKPAIVGICAPPSIPQLIFDRLRLGHDASTGFKLEPDAEADFLTCDTAYASLDAARAPSGLFARVASLFTPREAFAATTNMFYGGGVGGTVIELSPFAPVDPVLSMSGGVGGTVIELKILAQAASGAVSAAACSSTQAPIGTGFAIGCRPEVALTTYLGNTLENAPITFTLLAGGGAVAREAADDSCVAPYSTSAVVVPTDVNGAAAACWTLGNTPGANRLRATAGVGGQVPPGVTFANSIEFNATATAPSALGFTVQPAAGSTVLAGANIPVTVTVTDANGVTVAGFNGPVTLTLNKNTFAGGASVQVNAVAGVATFTNIAINTAATGYTLVATTRYNGGSPFTATGNSFDVSAAPGVGSTLTIVSGNGLSVPAGTLLTTDPTVRLRDRFGNAVAGATINWGAGGSSAGSVSPLSSVTDAAGQASTDWTIGAGANELLASYGSFASVLFTATGTTTTSSPIVINQCLPGGSGDPFSNNLTENPNAFWIPDPGNGKTIRDITL